MNDAIPTVPNGRDASSVEYVREVLSQSQARQARDQEWFDFAAEGYLLTDLQGVIQRVNFSAAKLLGTRKQFLLGKPLGLFMSEGGLKVFYERLTRLARGSEEEQWEACVSRSSGQPRELIVTATSASLESNIRLRWVLRDVTELRQAQRQSLQAERLAAIGQMAAGLGHESRNALQRIQACLALLGLRLKGQPDCLDLLGRIEKAQDDLQHLFEDVRTYALAPRLQRRSYNLRESWREAWENLASLPQWSSAELREDFDNVDLFCEADPFYIRQVFRNLLENALSSGANPVRIVLRCQPAGKSLCVRLSDNGPGIPAEVRLRLFEPFFTTKRRGSGLGLAICKRIIEAHGGSIHVQDDSLPGTGMVITLPRRGT